MPPVILKNAAAETPELWFYAEFGPEWADCISANLVRRALDELGPIKKLNIHVNCDGGDVIEALAIYNLLKNCGAKIRFLIEGIAASCGSWVPTCGDTIVIAQNALMMVHNPEGMVFGDSEEMRAQADILDTVKTSIVSMYASRTTKTTPEQFAAAMTAETWYTAQQALDAGLVDEIDPNKSTMVNVGSRFRNAPDWVKSMGTSQDWRKLMNERRQRLNELEGLVAE